MRLLLMRLGLGGSSFSKLVVARNESLKDNKTINRMGKNEEKKLM